MPSQESAKSSKIRSPCLQGAERGARRRPSRRFQTVRSLECIGAALVLSAAPRYPRAAQTLPDGFLFVAAWGGRAGDPRGSVVHSLCRKALILGWGWEAGGRGFVISASSELRVWQDAWGLCQR